MKAMITPPQQSAVLLPLLLLLLLVPPTYELTHNPPPSSKRLNAISQFTAPAASKHPANTSNLRPAIHTAPHCCQAHPQPATLIPTSQHIFTAHRSHCPNTAPPLRCRCRFCCRRRSHQPASPLTTRSLNLNITTHPHSPPLPLPPHHSAAAAANAPTNSQAHSKPAALILTSQPILTAHPHSPPLPPFHPAPQLQCRR